MKRGTKLIARRLAGTSIRVSANTALAITPRFLLALFTRAFIAYGVWRGRKRIARRGTLERVMSEAVSPLSNLTIELGTRRVVVRLLPWLAWFRGSVIYRSLSRKEILQISNRFSKKVNLRVVLPAGLSLPAGIVPGTLTDATESVLDWLANRLIER